MRACAFLMASLLPWFTSFASAQESTGAGPEMVAYMPVGFAFGSPHTAGTAIGGTLSWDLNPALSVQGVASALVRGRGADGLGLTVDVLARIGSTGMKVRPYVVAGLGLYRASCDLDDPRLQGPGSSAGQPGFGEMPRFYASRIGSMHDGRRSFTDPALAPRYVRPGHHCPGLPVPTPSPR
jgi:hypothetical protein